MRPSLLRFGLSQAPVVVVDDFSRDVGPIVDIAAALAPFPTSKGNYYPGLRRTIGEGDAAAYAYVERMLETAATFIGGAFETDGFDLLEASFSMVTIAPDALTAAQRVPHFDSTDPKYLAVMHYLGGVEGSGTAFYRQRETSIETVDETNLARFVSTAKRDGAELSGYIAGSGPHFEQIGAVEAVPDRLVIYQGCLLHSGIIPETMSLSPDPRRGRLTANIFVRAH